MVAPLVAAGLGAAAQIGGQYLAGKAQKKAAKKAAARQAAQSKANSALAQAVHQQNVGLFAPSAVQGQRAGNTLMELLLGAPSGGAGGAPVAGPAAGPTVDDQYAYAMSLLGPKLQAALANANAQERQQYDAWQMQNQPSIYEAGGLGAGGTGTGAPSALSAWDQFRGGTNYQWRLGEGQRALNQGYAGTGLDSGAAQIALQEHGQNFASNELGNWMNQLAQQQGIGLNSAGSIAGAGNTMYGNVSGTNQQATDASAASALVGGQAKANLWGTAGSALGQFASQAFKAPGAMGSSYGGDPYSATGEFYNQGYSPEMAQFAPPTFGPQWG
jgi:hypothetical protein